MIEALAREHLPKNDPHAKDVGPAIDDVAARLLRRHIGDFALQDSDLCRRFSGRRFGDAEVDDLHFAVVSDEDVVRADVAMNDAERRAVVIRELVRVVQPRERVGHDLGRDVRVEQIG